jgi:NAD(P)-dependent dehydrogenase (short-subunit alcohol dehydrogenase family)
MRLKDSIAIVTGAAQGIGRGIADRFTQEGAKVALVDYQKDVKIDPAQGQSFYHGDVSDPELWTHLVAELLAEYGRIDVLVNNVGIVQYESVHEVELERWNRALAVNLTSVMLGMRAVIPAMREQGRGSIINLSSIWGSVAAPGAASYHATKEAYTTSRRMRRSPTPRKTSGSTPSTPASSTHR